MSCYLFALKEFNSSFAEIDKMELQTLLDLISIYEKINDTNTKTKGNKKTVTYKVID